MLQLSKKLKIYIYSAFVLIGITVIIATLALLLAYDKPSNYFETSLPFSLMKSFVLVSSVFFATALFTLPKGELNGASPLTLPVSIASGLTATVFAVTGAYSIIDVLLKNRSGSAFSIVCGALSLLAAVYFAINLLTTDVGEKREKHALVGFTVPLSALMYVAVTYFDTTISMNAPAKLIFHLCLIFFMLWFLQELRAMIGKAAPRLYFSFGLIAMLFSALSSFPWLIAFIAGKVAEPLYPAYIVYNAVSFGIFCYTSVRLCVFVSARSLLERMADQIPQEESPESQEVSQEETDTNI